MFKIFKIFEEVESLRSKVDVYKNTVKMLDDEVRSLHLRLNSECYREIARKYEAKEHRFYKKAANIITSSEPIKVDLFAGWTTWCEQGLVGKTPNTEITYKDLRIFRTNKYITATYKNFKFNDENAKKLYDLHCSIYKGE